MCWDAALPDAMDFETISAAERYCVEQKFATALVVVKFRNEVCDIKFPAIAGNLLSNPGTPASPSPRSV